MIFTNHPIAAYAKRFTIATTRNIREKKLPWATSFVPNADIVFAKRMARTGYVTPIGTVSNVQC